MLTVGEAIRLGAERFEAAGLFFGHGTDNSWDEALCLVLYVLSLPWDVDPSVQDRELSQDEQTRIEHLFDRRIQERLPAAYLTGEGWFAGIPFHIDQRVLVPRSPIAELIENEFSPWLSRIPETMLDLCTGSGCIGIACALYLPETRVTLSDISSDALAVARQNITRYDLEDRVVAVESDLFGGLQGQRFDLIVSNPPYVDAEDLADMPAEYHHEPEIGLASGVDGLDFTRRLLEQAEQHLTEEGVLIVEVGNSWVALDEAFPDVPFLWLDFERGGHGVFQLTARQLRDCRDALGVV
ncbi:MAG: 50S ribosomal protein L3 N(5)-glutamine methyltransferase [Porticoccaceae bacterium]